MYRFDRQRNEFAPVSKWWKKVSPAFFEHSRTHPSGKETWSSARWLVGPGGSMDGLAVRPYSGWQSKWSIGPVRTFHATSDLHTAAHVRPTGDASRHEDGRHTGWKFSFAT